MIKNQNFVGNPNPDIGEETNFLRCNFAQPIPLDKEGKKRGVLLLAGRTGLTFTECNLTNCEPPDDSVLIGCNTTIRVASVESEKDTVTVAGFEITIQHHDTVVYGKYDPDEPGKYKDKPTPERKRRD